MYAEIKIYECHIWIHQNMQKYKYRSIIFVKIKIISVINVTDIRQTILTVLRFLATAARGLKMMIKDDIYQHYEMYDECKEI